MRLQVVMENRLKCCRVRIVEVQRHALDDDDASDRPVTSGISDPAKCPERRRRHFFFDKEHDFRDLS